jgi:hypothetical protein
MSPPNALPPLCNPQLKYYSCSSTLNAFQTKLRAKLLAWSNGSASVMNFRIVPVSFDWAADDNLEVLH